MRKLDSSAFVYHVVVLMIGATAGTVTYLIGTLLGVTLG